jgi:NADPH:quinone reductase-like Zn-dependent oxidoreductase
MVDQAGWSERVAARTSRMGVLPDTVSFSQAATLPVAGLTALRTLRLGGMLLGRNVLVTGASGGVGHFAVQLAAQAGAHVTGIARNPERGKAQLASGDVRLAGDMQAVQGPFDVILESVGGDSLTSALRLVGRDGIVVMFGNSSGQEARVAFGSIMSSPHARLYAFFIYESGEPPTFGSDLKVLADQIAAGRLQPHVGMETSWRDPMGTLQALRQRDFEGKAVLLID